MIIANILISLTALIAVQRSSGVEKQTIVIDGRQKELKDNSLKELVCKEAFNTWRDGKISESFMHPSVIEAIKKNSLDIDSENITNIFTKMRGRDVCQTIIKTSEGFHAFNSVVSLDGPLMFRITSLSSKKPTLEDIKAYL